MKTIEKRTLDPSDLVVVDHVVYRADMLTKDKPCHEQCHLFDLAAGKCTGTCWRYDNCDDIVFRYITSESLLSDGAVVVVTPTWREYDERRAEEIRRAESIAYHLKTRNNEPGKRGPKLGSHHKTKPTTGNIYEDTGRNRWVACIQFEGKVYKKSSKDKLVCVAWLKEKRAEFGIEEGGRHV